MIGDARYAAPAALDQVQRRALIAGGAGILLCALGFFLDRPAFYRAWLVGWIYWLGIALGCLAIMMLHHLTRGAWGLVARRVLEAAGRTLPVLALLFLPLLFGLQELYPWARPEAKTDHLLQAKAAYLNVPFFVARAALYFLIWGGFAFVLSRLSRRQDETGELYLTRRMQLLASAGIVLYCLAASFASVDWLMSLEPHWFSTIYGVYFLGGQGISALAFLIVVALFLWRREPMSEVLSPGHFHDWGKLLLAFVMLWTYFSFSQFLIIWSGNLPEEITWYAARTRGGWQWLAIALALFHFALPFVLLLSRDLKRRPQRLAAVAGWMLVMRWLDLVWQVEPAFSPERFTFHWLYLAAPLAVGGLWVWAWAAEIKKRPLLPLRDPWLPEALAHD
ncbi:MAG TPA: hypothetical protein VNJ70_15100 [Thermoanaerobaculia bacterium]|nr:hypothetical protein [Thermoanaerobaculia bacterium]